MTPTSEVELPFLEEKKRLDRISFIPTPEQIREACLEIQKGWSEEEFYGRAKFGPLDLYSAPHYKPEPVTLKEVSVADMLGDHTSAFTFAHRSHPKFTIKDC